MQTLTLENGTTIKVTDEQLQELMKSQKTESSIGWTPEARGIYWSISSGRVHPDTNTGHYVDDERIKSGNVYKTKAEARRVLDKQKALRRIHEYMYENDLVYVPDWNSSETYQIDGWRYMTSEPSEYESNFNNCSKGNLVFKTEEDRQQVLDNCKEDLEIYLKD